MSAFIEAYGQMVLACLIVGFTGGWVTYMVHRDIKKANAIIREEQERSETAAAVAWWRTIRTRRH
ncbi:hypothetical protein [Actinomycetospora sp. CA-053990]|uniref:hypothetical protein n=1 Tax=Actinomycetospora sp. CA-053990 TaxID=3239891 RepID=UPI003D8C3E51